MRIFYVLTAQVIQGPKELGTQFQSRALIPITMLLIQSATKSQTETK